MSDSIFFCVKRGRPPLRGEKNKLLHAQMILLLGTFLKTQIDSFLYNEEI